MLAGLARYARLAPELQQEFALCYDARLGEELRAAGARVHVLGGVRSSRPWQVRGGRQRLAGLLASGRYDTAVCHAWWPLAVFAPAVRRQSVRLGLWQHNLVQGRHWLQGWAARHRPDYAVALGPFMGTTLSRMFAGMEARVWAPPIPAPMRLGEGERTALRAGLGAGPETVAILLASRLEAWKGHRLLLESLARLEGALPWTAWIAGGAQGRQEQGYAECLRAEGVRVGLGGRVHWLGERNDVDRLMAAADLYCQPNTGPEPFGMVFAEAMAAGLPVITTAGGGPDDFLPDECGERCRADAGAIAERLRGLITQPERREAMGQAARARAAEVFEPAARMRALAGVLQA